MRYKDLEQKGVAILKSYEESIEAFKLKKFDFQLGKQLRLDFEQASQLIFSSCIYKLDEQYFNRFSHQTGAKSHHDVGYHQLIAHSFRTGAYFAVNSIKQLDNVSYEEIFEDLFVGIVHDLCKTEAYYYDSDIGSFAYNKEIIKHHALLSLQTIKKYVSGLKLSTKVLILNHMGGFQNLEDLKAQNIFDRLWRIKDRNLIRLQLLNNADMQKEGTFVISMLKDKEPFAIVDCYREAVDVLLSYAKAYKNEGYTTEIKQNVLYVAKGKTTKQIKINTL